MGWKLVKENYLYGEGRKMLGGGTGTTTVTPLVTYRPLDKEISGGFRYTSNYMYMGVDIHGSTKYYKMELLADELVIASKQFIPADVPDWHDGSYNSISGEGVRQTFDDNTLFRIKLYEYVIELPSTPSYIDVSSKVKEGESIPISWGSSSEAVRYYLYRSINDGSYTQIYSGSLREYTDTAQEDWETVQYRVRSYNSDGYSSYRTSDIIKVIHFPQLQLKVNGELKTAEKGYVKVNNQLMEIDKMWVKINGKLKEVE